MSRPKLIYKYESFSTRSLENLKAQSIYFSSPRNFNDPYDCALKARIKEPSVEELEKYRANLLSRTDLKEDVRNDLKNSSSDTLRNWIVDGCRDLIEEKVEEFLNLRGVSCFSEVNDDLLMWSHYGGRYKGFCLEFDTNFDPFQMIRKVKYSNEIPELDPIASLVSEDYDQYMDMFRTKSVNWAYEREWRNMHDRAGTLFTYNAEALKSVYFGPDASGESIEITCLILAGQNPDVSFWRGKRSDDEFKVKFEIFTYTSYIDAKRNGHVT